MESKETLKKRLGESGLQIPLWQAIKNRIRIILWPLSVAFLIVAVWGGWVAYVRHNDAQALAMYERAMIEGPEQRLPALELLVQEYPHAKASQLARLDIGHIYYRNGKIDLAIKAYESCLEKGENQGLRPAVLLSLGYCFEMKADYARSLEYLNKAAESGKGSIKTAAYLSLGRAYKKTKNPTEAINAYKKALSASRGLQDSYRLMAEWEVAQLTALEGAVLN